MQHASATTKPAGVAKYDVSSGATGGMHGQPGMIVPVTAGAAITAGQQIQSDATGQAIPLASGPIAGLAMSGCASGADCQVKLA
jgi:hypothetical protein